MLKSTVLGCSCILLVIFNDIPAPLPGSNSLIFHAVVVTSSPFTLKLIRFSEELFFLFSFTSVLSVFLSVVVLVSLLHANKSRQEAIPAMNSFLILLFFKLKTFLLLRYFRSFFLGI